MGAIPPKRPKTSENALKQQAMNWRRIKEKYPKAFKKLKWFYELIPIEINDDNRLGWYYTDGVHVVCMWTDMGNDMLYDFFDKQRIIIDIHYKFIDINGIYKFMFVPSIVVIALKERTEISQYGKREHAETVAFTEAFEILEKQCK